MGDRSPPHISFPSRRIPYREEMGFFFREDSIRQHFFFSFVVLSTTWRGAPPSDGVVREIRFFFSGPRVLFLCFRFRHFPRLFRLTRSPPSRAILRRSLARRERFFHSPPFCVFFLLFFHEKYRGSFLLLNKASGRGHRVFSFLSSPSSSACGLSQRKSSFSSRQADAPSL